MADLDYGEIRVYPGSYDDYMTAATQVIESLQAENAKKKAQISELKAFVSRFSANASKSKQATSRAKQLDKINLAEIKPSSRKSPFIRFDQDKKLHRLALEVEGLGKSYETELFKDFNLMIEVGARVAIIGPNGIGKSTLLKCLVGDEKPTSGTVKWSENADISYCAQDHTADFTGKTNLFEWMEQWGKPSDDDQMIRGTLGRLLFSQDDIDKRVNVLSGGEQGRMIFGKLMLQRANIMLLDEPTNHLDMESIESLNLALEHYPGTLIFVSHDREFVSSLATRVIELTPTGIVDFQGTYEDYLSSQNREEKVYR
jgi:ATPase subunit of ABC transporter with duplicated ATPase domains